MSQHPLDPFRSMIEDGVADAELAKMAEVTVTEVRKYKARLKAEAKKASEPEPEPEEKAEKAPKAKAAPKGAKLVEAARELVTAHPGRLVVRLIMGFGIIVKSPRSGKPVSMPVQRGDYKDAMAVKIVSLCVEHGHSDRIVLMDPSDADYPPVHPNIAEMT